MKSRSGNSLLNRHTVSRFRSSHHCAAASVANFGIEGHSQLIDLVWLWFRSPHFGLAAKMPRTAEPHTSGPPSVSAPLARQIAAFDHDGLDLARAVAAEGRGAVVFGRGEAGDALLEGRELDHHEAMEFCRPFHDLIAAAAGEHLAAELGDDLRYEVGVLLVFDRIIDLRPRNPVGRHGDVLARVSTPTSRTLGAPSANRKRQRLLQAKGRRVAFRSKCAAVLPARRAPPRSSRSDRAMPYAAHARG